MSMEEPSKKGLCPQLVKLNQAFKLAEKWVNNMTKTMGNESVVVVLEPRPARLGIGAAIPHQYSKVVLSNDLVERKLRAKLDAEKRRVVRSAKESALSAKDESRGESSDDEESESRTKAFAKKRTASLASYIQPKKTQKL